MIEVETKIELNFVQKKSALQSARQMGLNSAYIASIEVGRTKGTVDVRHQSSFAMYDVKLIGQLLSAVCSWYTPLQTHHISRLQAYR